MEKLIRVDLLALPLHKTVLGINAARSMSALLGQRAYTKPFRNAAEVLLERGAIEFCSIHDRYYIPGPKLLKLTFRPLQMQDEE